MGTMLFGWVGRYSGIRITGTLKETEQLPTLQGLPRGSPPANAGDSGLIPGSGRSPGEGNSNPLQYSCLGNPMDRGARWATVHRVTKRVGT